MTEKVIWIVGGLNNALTLTWLWEVVRGVWW